MLRSSQLLFVHIRQLLHTFVIARENRPLSMSVDFLSWSILFVAQFSVDPLLGTAQTQLHQAVNHYITQHHRYEGDTKHC